MIMDERINISKVSYEKNDVKLLERIFKFKKGMRRIVCFMIVGIVVGLFSNAYTTDSFIVTKVIFAIPYKISEAIYVSIIGTGFRMRWEMFVGVTEFFQHSYIATFLAERITPAFIGMILFGSLGYFTGDKRVFTLERFVKFLGIQCVVLMIFVGSVYGVNAKAVADNNALKDVETFCFYNPERKDVIMGKTGEKVKTAFEKELCKENEGTVDKTNEIPVGIYFKGMRRMQVVVNTQENYLITDNGTKYHVSEEFAAYVQEFYDYGSIDGMPIL